MEKDVAKLPKLLYKLRLVYNDVFVKYEFIPYVLPIIKSLKIVYSNKIEYGHKYLDRNRLKNLYKQKGNCDDIIIIRENLVTDTHYCNVALLKDNIWYTPATPLLEGTKRQQLLAQGLIHEKLLSSLNLKAFEKIRLFNAMIDFGEIELDIKEIF